MLGRLLREQAQWIKPAYGYGQQALARAQLQLEFLECRHECRLRLGPASLLDQTNGTQRIRSAIVVAGDHGDGARAFAAVQQRFGQLQAQMRRHGACIGVQFSQRPVVDRQRIKPPVLAHIRGRVVAEIPAP